MKHIIIFISTLLVLKLYSQTTTNIQFNSDTFTLDGVLTTPNNTVDRHPIVVFVHGSGPNDGNQTTPIIGSNASCLYPNLLNDTIRNFLDISNFLVANGYATFRFDKRSLTYGSSIDQTSITVYDFIDDVESAIEYVKTLTNIDTSCITLLGHSQGGTFISYIANKRNDISKLIALATPSTPIDTLISMQIRELYYICQNDTITGDNVYNQSLNVYNQIRNGSWPNNTPVNGAYPTFWKSWIDISDSTTYYLNEATLPTFFSFGINDFNVPISDTSDFYNNLIIDYSINTFNDLSHFLTDSSTPIVKNELLSSLLEWLDIKECNLETNIIVYKNDFKVINTTDFLEIYFENIEDRHVNIYNLIGQRLYSQQLNNKSIKIEKTKNNIFCIVEITNTKTLTKDTFKINY